MCFILLPLSLKALKNNIHPEESSSIVGYFYWFHVLWKVIILMDKYIFSVGLWLRGEESDLQDPSVYCPLLCSFFDGKTCRPNSHQPHCQCVFAYQYFTVGYIKQVSQMQWVFWYSKFIHTTLSLNLLFIGLFSLPRHLSILPPAVQQ
jgi:hypothetical protein